MSKEEGSKTVVIGGRNAVQQQYCGTVGGQSTDYSTMDTEIKVRLSFPLSLLLPWLFGALILIFTDHAPQEQ
jgi:hypothetical protein